MQPRALGRRLAAPVLAGEEAACEGEIGDEPDPEALAGRQQLRLGVARDPRVLALLGHERGQTPCRPLSHAPPRRARRRSSTSRSHAPCPPRRARERAERLLERRHAIGVVVLVEVDPVGLQPAQRILDRAADVLPAPRRRLAVAGAVAELRRQDDLVAAPGQRAADDLLAAATAAVDLRRVEEGHARVERGVDHGPRGRLVDPAAEVVAAEADDRHLETRAAELPCAHDCSLWTAA